MTSDTTTEVSCLPSTSQSQPDQVENGKIDPDLGQNGSNSRTSLKESTLSSPSDHRPPPREPDLDAVEKLAFDVNPELFNDPAYDEMVYIRLDEAVEQTEKRHEYLTHRFNKLDKKHDYENYDELCDLGDKVMNGFGIMEDNQIYKIDIRTRVRLTLMVLRAQNEALNFYEQSLNEFGNRRDQALAAEYETLTFLAQFLSKTYMEYHVTWLKSFIEQ